MEHPALFAICAFLMLMVVISWVGYRLIYKPGKFMRQLGRPVITADRPAADGREAAKPSPARGDVPARSRAHVPSSEADVATLKADLIRAGFPLGECAAGFLWRAHHGHAC